jgi:hypothetical protein
MPYYYSTAAQVNSSGSANTTLQLASFWTKSTNHRAVIQKIIGGSYMTPADNAILLRLQGLTAGAETGGTAIVPLGMIFDAPAAGLGAQTGPTNAGATFANPVVQLAFNQRGTAMWAAFNADEGVGLVGTGLSNSNSDGVAKYLTDQSTGTTVAINFKVIHSE